MNRFSVKGDGSSFIDGFPNGDIGREALSGGSPSGSRTLATSDTGFGADFGISLQPGSFAGLFNLSSGATSFGFVAGGGLDTSETTTTLSFSINIGLPAATRKRRYRGREPQCENAGG